MEKLRLVSGFATKIKILEASVALLDQEVSIPDPVAEIQKLRDLASLARQTKILSGEIAEMEDQLAQKKRELAEVDSDIAAIPSCPTCSRPLNAQHTGKHRRLSA